MATVFDGDTLIITLDTPVSGTYDLDVQRLYSEWKEWQLSSFQNMGYPAAFRAAGGDPINATTTGVPTFFLRNDFGWRIRPFEADQTINISGQLAPQDSTLPMTVATLGGYTVLGFNVQPVAQVISSGVTLAATEVTAIRDAVFANLIEGGYSFEEVIRIIAAACAGDIEQAVDGTYTIRGLDEATARILGELSTNNGRTINSIDAA
jgi:hypothetical protein